MNRVRMALLVGAPSALHVSKLGTFGGRHPCFAVAFDFLGQGQWIPVVTLHQCDESTAKSLAVSLANTLNQTRAVVGRTPCPHPEGKTIELLDPVLIHRDPHGPDGHTVRTLPPQSEGR